MINIAEALKDSPKGTKLYSPIFGDVYLDKIRPHLAVVVRTPAGQNEEFLYDGRFGINGECMLFPSKENHDWNTFQKPFEDGDIIYVKSKKDGGIGLISIFKNETDTLVYDYCCVSTDTGNFYADNGRALICKNDIGISRLADEEEKEKIFKAIKDNGYRWNIETKNLEKLHRFKPGDVLVSQSGNIVLCSHIDNEQIIHFHCILDREGDFRIGNDIGVGKESNCKLASDCQKQKLLDKLKNSGYSYNPVTNQLEKWVEPKFKHQDDRELITSMNTEEKLDMGNVSDGYHTFNELYEFRLLYNAALFNEWALKGLYNVHKSRLHSDGTIPFGDSNWFIVVAQLPTGQISNHYEMKDWDLFDVPERKTAAEYDGHTVQDVRNRLYDFIKYRHYKQPYKVELKESVMRQEDDPIGALEHKPTRTTIKVFTKITRLQRLFLKIFFGLEYKDYEK